MTEFREENLALDVLERGTDQRCGEGCGRRARIRLDGDYTYCGDCLFHLVQLGHGFVDAVELAKDNLKAFA